MYKVKKEYAILAAIVLSAILLRIFVVWVGRTGFVGWFNHTYYYYVETKGLLTKGALPYPDMPLLFYLYAFTAKLLSLAGIPENVAIVSATKFWMCVVPALVALPAYLIIKNINANETLSKRLWLLVGASAILPLSILHLPEFSQKNMLGILLLALALWSTKKLLDQPDFLHRITLVVVFILILLTHFGTTGAAVIYAIALIAAWLYNQKQKQHIATYTGVLILGIAGTMAIIYLIDVQRFDRVFFYLTQSLKSSFVGVLFSSNTVMADRLLALPVIILPASICLFLFFTYRKHRQSLKAADQVFWLSNIFFLFLLSLPLYDQLLFARFTLFLSLPLLIVLTYLLRYSHWKTSLKNGLTGLVVASSLLLLFGEVMSSIMHNRDKDQVYQSLLSMQEQTTFTANDLILTKNGAEHICNWFLGTKAGVITALNKKDFTTYNNIYILNPSESTVDPNELAGKRADNEVDRYFFMLHNIAPPQNAVEVYQSTDLELYRLDAAPAEWEYDAHGNWISYGR